MLPRTLVTSKRTLLATGASVVIIGGIGAGVATADTGSTPSATPSATSSAASSATPSASSTAKHAATTRARVRALLARVEHGQLVLGGKHPETLDVQRGTVQAVSPTSITVKSTDGYTAVYTVKSTTKVRKKKVLTTIGSVDLGDHVLIAATGTGAPETAFRIRDVS